MKTLLILLGLFTLTFALKFTNINEVEEKKKTKEDVTLIFSQIHKEALDSI